MKQISLESDIRRGIGKGYSHRLRNKGVIPAVLYGGGKETIPIQVKSKDLIHILHEGGKNVIINLTFPNSTQETVILKEKQTHPYKNLLLHADFFRISLEEKFTISVPIELVGKAKGVKEGGILEQFLWEIEISTLPTQVPKSIEIDVTDLEIGSSLHVKDLVVEEGIEIETSPELVILSIVQPKEVVEEEEVSPLEEKAEPEVIRERRKEKEEE